MKTYLCNVALQVEVDGPDEDAVVEVMQDYIGEGDSSFRVYSLEILDYEELK
jgi:hypothetical protein